MRFDTAVWSVCCVFLLSCTVLHGQQTLWTQSEFLLSAYNPPCTSHPEPPYPDSLFTDYLNAHMDIFLWARDEDALIDKIHQYGIKYFIDVQSIGDENDDVEFLLRGENEEAPPDIPEYLLQEIDDLVDKYKDDPNLLGYYLCDEPFASAFDNIAKVVDRIRSKDPNRVCYVNLWPYFPNEPGDLTPPEGDDAYLESFIQKTNIRLLSYDRYNFYNLSDDNEAYFDQIERIRRKAVKYDLPFCNIVQAIGTNGTSVSWDSPGDGEHLDWRTPNEAEHRWLVYTSLVYGVHGLVWFHWDYADWGVIENPDKDLVYPSLQSINGEIDSLKQIMLKLKTKQVYHVRGNHIERISETPDVVVQLPQQDSLIVGTFADEAGEENYFMLMNKDYSHPLSTTVKMSYFLTDLQLFDVNDNSWKAVSFETDSSGTTFTADLREGGGKLYRFSGSRLLPSEFDFTLAPNPFETTTTLTYSIPEMFHGRSSHQVKLEVYDGQGQKVATLVDEEQGAGRYFVEFKGSRFPSGTYLCVLSVDGEQVVEKMIKLL